jgi:hypothetical protein
MRPCWSFLADALSSRPLRRGPRAPGKPTPAVVLRTAVSQALTYTQKRKGSGVLKGKPNGPTTLIARADMEAVSAATDSSTAAVEFMN